MTDYVRLISIGVFFYLVDASAVDYGSYIAPVITGVLAIFTLYSQLKQRKIESDHQASLRVLEAWQKLVDSHDDTIKNQNEEMKDMRHRLRAAESGHRVCEKNQMKLVLRLSQAGVELDYDKIWDDLLRADLDTLKVEMRADEDRIENDLHRTDAGIHKTSEVLAK